jgi:hypothetical protein
VDNDPVKDDSAAADKDAGKDPAAELVREDQVRSLDVVRALLPWRGKLASGFGTGHGNASLKLVDVLIVMLAGFFNPLVRSQRLVEALSSQEWMRDKTGVARIARSTLSDAMKRFDPEALRPLIEGLAAQVPALGRRDADLESLTKQVIAADGSFFALAGDVAWALHNRKGADGKMRPSVRWNLQLDIRSFTPVDADISGADDASEPDAFIRRLKPDAIYVVDRGFVSFRFLNAVLDRGSSFVVRQKKGAHFDVRAPRELAARDHEMGVLGDEEGTLPGPRSKGNADCRSFTAKPPERLLRRVTVRDERNKCEVTLLTDLLDVPAHVVALLYRKRWQVELFFKWIKCHAAMDHLVSKSREGITFQFYVAIVATLLLHISTGRRVSKYALFWLGSVASGQATWEEMQAGLAKIEREKALEKARLSRKRLAAKQGA